MSPNYVIILVVSCLMVNEVRCKTSTEASSTPGVSSTTKAPSTTGATSTTEVSSTEISSTEASSTEASSTPESSSTPDGSTPSPSDGLTPSGSSSSKSTTPGPKTTTKPATTTTRWVKYPCTSDDDCIPPDQCIVFRESDNSRECTDPDYESDEILQHQKAGGAEAGSSLWSIFGRRRKRSIFT